MTKEGAFPLDPASAVHEAGHALVAVKVGAQVVFCDVWEGAGGVTRWSASGLDEVRVAAVFMAGGEAERIVFGSADEHRSVRDLAMLEDVAIATESADVATLEQNGRELASRILSEHRAALDSLSNAILDRPVVDGHVSLTGDEVAALVEVRR